MSDCNLNIILDINKLNLELKKKLEIVSKWRAECAQLQLEFLKLYTPECLEILESLKQITDTNINLDKS
ncbi:uncharacterized protein LOC105734920 [Apis florea]|uniref:Uncharacterized protein LOC102653856 n=1 Tax=Apis mellifera TaxID=7460 RepID=A0A7M7M533_APIME|nr:uncharacterized protein LOC102653856 [Apis mellifera]XP_031369114.1 uncharacterized protein LOC102673168 [Apis dorsata]XP_031771048.1 uncharacterized protein LOC105734920 [Apis florea]KAG6799882.1 hypothetical protein HZU73_04690 [Apis mellifera caucasica]KAG9435802.1 hypothetical protein HZU67_02225 [Apis mellifera carnica]|eukprot:XP_016770179.1 uncharacterized protein LOC102653856 [Apis mellifera]